VISSSLEFFRGIRLASLFYTIRTETKSLAPQETWQWPLM